MSHRAATVTAHVRIGEEDAQLTDPSKLLAALGDAIGTRSASARSTAALLSNPGCERRAVLDAARVDLAVLAERLGAPAQFGQSPFAIGQGNRFEERIKSEDYAALIEAINEVLGIFDGVTELRSVNLERVGKLRGRKLIVARAEATAEVLSSIARGDADAPHVIDHGVTTLDVGGNTVYLEQDALAFRDGEHLRICEVKGFPIIDGTASPAKVGGAARQTAVYVASIQDTLVAQGFDPGLVSAEVLLICPKNFSIGPVAVLVDVDREVRSLRRQLRRRSVVGDIIQRVERDSKAEGVKVKNLVADAQEAKPGSKKSRKSAAALVNQLPFRYQPECLSSCDLARHCRTCSQKADDPGWLGGDVAGLLGGVGSISDAIALADGSAPSAEQAEVAALLRNAQIAIEDATGSTP